MSSSLKATTQQAAPNAVLESFKIEKQEEKLKDLIRKLVEQYASGQERTGKAPKGGQPKDMGLTEKLKAIKKYMVEVNNPPSQELKLQIKRIQDVTIVEIRIVKDERLEQRNKEIKPLFGGTDGKPGYSIFEKPADRDEAFCSPQIQFMSRVTASLHY